MDDSTYRAQKEFYERLTATVAESRRQQMADLDAKVAKRLADDAKGGKG